MRKAVYSFADGKAEGGKDMKRILGGKGAGLHEMTSLGIPVPPGFTISAEVCAYAENHRGEFPEGLEDEVDAALRHLERVTGKKLGDPADPLLVSVRSGAAASMPGMMDTILNLGLTSAAVAGLAAKTRDEKFASDCRERFVGMWRKIVGGEPPEIAREQLRAAIAAVFRSWQNERAKTYRKLYKLDDLLGTAVNVQAMVFGNRGETSATGVCFTRDPSTGENRFYGEFLLDAQGEDVVAGIRTPRPIAEMQAALPQAYRQLLDVKDRLEKHYRDVQDIEFTVEEGKLFLLQCRTGKRTGVAAVRLAVDMVEEGLIDRRDALQRVDPDHLDQLLHPIFDAEEKSAALKAGRLLAKGLNAAPGAASGGIVFEAKDAEERARRGEAVILVRLETSPEDIGGMAAAQGILTATGGMTSHAAVVGRGMGKCCVVGCGAIGIDLEKRVMTVGTPGGRMGGDTPYRVLAEGAAISIDGSTGEVIQGRIATAPSEIVQVLVRKSLPAERSAQCRAFAKVLSWADEVRQLKVRANADTPEDARAAVAFGAEGIGLCRTEHMFFGPDRIPAVRAMILAETDEARRAQLDRLEPMQREDFIGIFQAMGERPVTVRLLDPPLHEFLPREHEQFVQLARDLGVSEERVREKARALHEFNPMLGHRGCRLGLTFPEIYDMQVRALVDAACRLHRDGIAIRPEVMFPLVATGRELEVLRARAVRIAEEAFERHRCRVDVLWGTMIEIPRAALTADEIAAHADFFSFGTNDLTQCTYGISRDDAGSFLPAYQAQGIFPRDPFATIDRRGVGALVRGACERGRASKARLKLGVCGEHGGDPESIRFFDEIGLHYVSCSPYRVPVARLAAAQAVLAAQGIRHAGAA